ncbi:hypothetical protein [Rhizobium sp. NFR07]|uniref:hypothetical protein n=1 Tax=Rhizobium sp. NFR07 TaxID=1566262 RepID=UPI0011605AC9|nr:hypothetical protein [Rhizobium sp. NFR07]
MKFAIIFAMALRGRSVGDGRLKDQFLRDGSRLKSLGVCANKAAPAAQSDRQRDHNQPDYIVENFVQSGRKKPCYDLSGKSADCEHPSEPGVPSARIKIFRSELDHLAAVCDSGSDSLVRLKPIMATRPPFLWRREFPASLKRLRG